jgi:hypothetical protein
MTFSSILDFTGSQEWEIDTFGSADWDDGSASASFFTIASVTITTIVLLTSYTRRMAAGGSGQWMLSWIMIVMA